MKKSNFERKVLNIDTYKLNEVLVSIKMFVDQVNNGFIPVCLSNGVEPTTGLLHKVMTDKTAVQNVFVAKIDKDLISLGASGQLMKDNLVQAAKPNIEALEKAVATLHLYESRCSRMIVLAGCGGMNIYPHVEIIEGKAILSESSKAKFEEQFTNAIETERQKEAYDLLVKIAADIETIRTMANESAGHVFELVIDPVFFQMDLMGTVEVNPNIIKYF